MPFYLTMCIWLDFFWEVFLCQLPSQRLLIISSWWHLKKLVTVGASTSSTCSWRGLKKRGPQHILSWLVSYSNTSKIDTPLGFNISLLSRHFWVDDFPRFSLWWDMDEPFPDSSLLGPESSESQRLDETNMRLSVPLKTFQACDG